MEQKHCACGRIILPHWKECNDCTNRKRNFHPESIAYGPAVQGIPLRQQRLQTTVERVTELYENLIRDYYTLEKQHEKMQEDFNNLSRIKSDEIVELLVKKLSTGTKHT